MTSVVSAYNPLIRTPSEGLGLWGRKPRNERCAEEKGNKIIVHEYHTFFLLQYINALELSM